MIVCSCNVPSDGQVRSAITGVASRTRISQVYASLGCVANCGRCACTLKIILKEIGSFATAVRTENLIRVDDVTESLKLVK